MAPKEWDAYRYLNITSRDSNGASCAGYTIHGQRCRWDISNNRFSRICSILDEFETKAPTNAISSLRRLAQLSLCDKYHQNQASEKIGEWKVAIQEATKFYERAKALKKKNRELNEVLIAEFSEREKLERKVEEEVSQRKQELKSISSMTLEVSSLRAKLKQAETEARKSKDTAQKKSNSYDERVAEFEEHISDLCERWENDKLGFGRMLEKEAQTSRSTRSELEKLQESQRSLVDHASELTSQLETEFHAKIMLQSNLNQIEDERNLILLQKDQFKSQLEIAAKKIHRIELSLKKAEAARDMLSEDEQRVNDHKFKAISDEKAQLEEINTVLVQKLETLNSLLLSERHDATELRHSLETATDTLLRTDKQLRTLKEDLYYTKDELGKLQVQFAKALEDLEEEQRKFSLHQAASLASMDELIQKMAHNKLHLFRTFFMNLFEATSGWVKSVFAGFGTSKRRKAHDLLTMEENLSPP